MYALKASDQVMLEFKMRDSEPSVKSVGTPVQVHETESESFLRAKILTMPSNRDTILSDFVRMKIAEWQAAGREQQQLAELAGFGKSTVAQVKKGTGVGAKTAPGFAKAFGYSDVQEMVDAAYEWRKSSGEALDALLAEEAVQTAITQVKTFVVGATDEAIRAILSAFIHPRFRGRDAMFWVETLGNEAKRDVESAIAHQLSLRNRRLERAVGKRKEEGAWRTAALIKNQAEEAQVAAERAAVKKRSKARAS